MTTIDSKHQDLLEAINNKTINFKDVINHIDNYYQFSPVAFKNGKQTNTETENHGSAKVFGFAKLNGLDKPQTLSLFVEHYQAVLDTPEGDDHANIRNFMAFGWEGLDMPTNPLVSI